MKSRFSPSLWTAFVVVSVALLVTASWSIIKVISPAPPRALAMSTGALDGAYHQFGLKYQALLKTNGFEGHCGGFGHHAAPTLHRREGACKAAPTRISTL